LAWGVPFVGVNHLEGHLYACLLERPDLPMPAIVLLVSGGHTMLVHVKGYGDYSILGGTIDDAAGEAYDKVARVLGLGYPGGPIVDKLAKDGDPKAVPMPRLMRDDSYDFSFSGIKTAVARKVQADPSLGVADVAAGFQRAVVDSLVTKAKKAVVDTGAQALCLAGGVAANSELRARTQAAADELGVACLLPAMKYCTDNAAMIAAAGWWRLQSDGPTSLDEAAYPNLRLATT
jgi:N6-L-threonylcarbamoyladenine synthase